MSSDILYGESMYSLPQLEGYTILGYIINTDKCVKLIKDNSELRCFNCHTSSFLDTYSNVELQYYNCVKDISLKRCMCEKAEDIPITDIIITIIYISGYVKKGEKPYPDTEYKFKTYKFDTTFDFLYTIKDDTVCENKMDISRFDEKFYDDENLIDEFSIRRVDDERFIEPEYVLKIKSLSTHNLVIPCDILFTVDNYYLDIKRLIDYYVNFTVSKEVKQTENPHISQRKKKSSPKKKRNPKTISK